MHTILAFTLAAGLAHLRKDHKDSPLLNDAPKPNPPAAAPPAEVHHAKSPASQTAAAPPDLSAATDALGSGAAAVEEAQKTAASTAASTGTEALEGVMPVHLPHEAEWEEGKSQHATHVNDAKKWEVLAELGIFILGFATWFFVCYGKPRATVLTSRGPGRGVTLSGDDFAPVTLFSCCGGHHSGRPECGPATFMCEACLCWGCMWAETVSRARVLGFTAAMFLACSDMILTTGHFAPLGGQGHFWVDMAVLIVGFCWFCFRVYSRGRLRAAMKQRSDSTAVCFDILVHFFCVPCAVAQEAEFQQLYYQGATDV